MPYRIETDDSFIPHASSSRRLSSDIFNDQQSQDSFFITKNKTEPVNSASLDAIPEMAQADVTDITPSGDIKDLDSTTGKYTKYYLKQSFSLLNFLESEKYQKIPHVKQRGNKEDAVKTESIKSRIAAIQQSLQNENGKKVTAEPPSKFVIISEVFLSGHFNIDMIDHLL